MLRKGIVVATHPEDHSVDIVMADDGSRLTGVPVMAGPGTSARTGTVDLPDVPAKANKWDITKRDGQDMEVLVGELGNRHPVVVGFLFPQVNQVLPKSPGTRVVRHRSDITQVTDADGNMQMTWPNGTYLRIGEAPDHQTLQVADSASVDRNTSRRMHVRLGLAGGAFTLTITPDGACTMEMKQDMTIKTDAAVHIEAAASATVKAPTITLDGDTTITKTLTVQGDTSLQGVTSRGKDISSTHVHKDTMSGPGTSGVPA
jgi:phage baseplate assembly protein gpV